MKAIKVTLPVIFLVIGTFVLSSVAASGMMLHGTITQLNLDVGALTLSQLSAQDIVAEDKVDISVLPRTQFKGVGSLGDLEIGDAVQVDVSQNEVTGTWEANVIEMPVTEEEKAKDTQG